MPEILNYQQAENYLSSGRNPFRRTTLDANTYLQKMPLGEIQVILYGTPVVTYWPDGRIILYSGGFRTVTTKRRMNAYQNQVRVFQHNFEWFVSFPDTSVKPFIERMDVSGIIRLHNLRNQDLPLVGESTYTRVPP